MGFDPVFVDLSEVIPITRTKNTVGDTFANLLMAESQTPEGKFLIKNNSQFTSKTGKIWLDANVDGLFSESRIKLYMVTCNFTPDTGTAEHCWATVTENEDAIVNMLHGGSNVEFVVSTVEEHAGKADKKDEPTPATAPVGAVANTTKGKGKQKAKPVAKHVDKHEVHDSLTGYPHIHMMIAVSSTTGIYPNSVSFTKSILDTGTFNDVFQSGTKTKGNRNMDRNSGMFAYVMKNSRYIGSTNKLNRLPTRVWNFSANRGLELILQQMSRIAFIEVHSMCNTQGRPHQVDLMTDEPLVTTERVPEDVIVRTSNLPPMSEVTLSRKLEGTTSRIRARNWVITVMERLNLRIFRGGIHQKVEASLNTWKKWGEYDRLIGVSADEHHVDDVLPHRKEMTDLMSLPDQSIFPTLAMPYEWVEYNDCMMNLLCGIVVPKSAKYTCFAYYPSVTKADIATHQMWTGKRPNLWLNIVTNSDLYSVASFYASMYRLLVPKKIKDKAPFLHGPPNSGKTSLIVPFLSMFPESDIGYFRPAGGFEMAGLAKKEIVSWDEAERSTHRGDGLKLVEGGSYSENGKHKDTQTVMITCRPVILSNSEDWMSILVTGDDGASKRVADPAYEVRVEKYALKTIPEAERDPRKYKEMVEVETPWIVLCCATIAFAGCVRKHESDNGLLVMDDQAEIDKVLDMTRVCGYVGK